MVRGHGRAWWVAIAVTVLVTSAWPVHTQPQAPTSPARQTFKAGIDLVTINVVVRDRNGNPVRDLTRHDFAVVEDGRTQAITTFRLEEIASAPIVATTDVPVVLGSLGRTPAPAARAAEAAAEAVDAHDRRLMVLFFDLSSMQPEETERAVAAARTYVDTKLGPADIMAIVSLGTSLRVDQDFTANRDVLRRAINGLSLLEGTGETAAAETDPDNVPDTGNAFTPDDSEFAIFTTDQRLDALRRLTDALAPIPQKKSLVYFSSGMSQTGLDNEVQLRLAVDRAVRANVSVYAADMRGLQAQVPGGDASTASARGSGAFSGRNMQQQFDRMAASQDALSTLAEDTGGRAFFDANDFGAVFDRVVADTTTYYLIGYTSTNTARDGRFRRLRVTVKRPGLRLEHRAGYYAPRDFAHSGRDDRELQLQEQLESDLPVTDLPIHGSAAYFRVKDDRFFVPLWLAVPGSHIPFARASQRDRATLDVLGVIRDRQRRPVAWIRDTVRLNVDEAANVQRKSILYQTSFELPPGQYLLKAVVRENQTGTLGSYEATLTVPRLPASGLKLSTVVLGTQVQPASSGRANRSNPLVRDGQELVPSVTHVASSPQQLFFYFEVYDPARPGAAAGRPTGDVRILASVAFFKGRTRVYQTPLAEASLVTDPDRRAVGIRLSVPAVDLEPGLYTCQLSVVDDVAGAFAFPRLALYLRR